MGAWVAGTDSCHKSSERCSLGCAGTHPTMNRRASCAGPSATWTSGFGDADHAVYKGCAVVSELGLLHAGTDAAHMIPGFTCRNHRGIVRTAIRWNRYVAPHKCRDGACRGASAFSVHGCISRFACASRIPEGTNVVRRRRSREFPCCIRCCEQLLLCATVLCDASLYHDGSYAAQRSSVRAGTLLALNETDYQLQDSGERQQWEPTAAWPCCRCCSVPYLRQCCVKHERDGRLVARHIGQGLMRPFPFWGRSRRYSLT